ncbi:hypothetical protein AMTRI_Chr07g23360 [Amborella trichopoda]|uniref:Uncharacterized protein n=1 Tax=Amborella trichopoda TaxID=13333 RepID=U5CRU7_AMBTC|nr:uncharacterized protein LOC18444249 [Amborella trichopoda]ERN15951.1 hypothetical protein AMTR_s00175p00029860 [Amborella trichopoda]|eukprot:XP_006854484.1 uncharacterized protein LOC18444249 [Amborella trichopoda]
MSESFGIQISSNLVNRLIIEDEVKKKPKKAPARNKSRKWPLPLPQQAPNLSHHHDDSTIKMMPPFLPLPLRQLPLEIPSATAANEEEINAIHEVLRESERVLDRLQKQEENLAEQVTLRAKELRDKEFKLPYQKPVPCLREKDACLQCYKEHSKDNPLKCADVVNAFADCARRAREQQQHAV